ncbi:MAG: AAA family ATPase [Anaerolineae bacterium]|nr:AAA family ATPase [Anaerolineae bacterium]
MLLEGFKSFRDYTEVTFGDLTILAGANNAGKSTLMQPLLLMRQTLEAVYDPGPLLLQGANTALSSAEAMFWSARGQRAPLVRFGVFGVTGGRMPQRVGYEVALALDPSSALPLSLVEGTWHFDEEKLSVRPNAANGAAQVERCFAYPRSKTAEFEIAQRQIRGALEGLLVHHFMHVPATRGLAAPFQTLAAVRGDAFAGRFVDYVPGIIYRWQTLQPQTLKQLGGDLRELELAGRIQADRAGSLPNAVMLKASRLLDTDDADLVSLADLGSGLAHALPVVVALLIANSGWLVYIEEPEIHLHPRAIRALPGLILRAVRRGAQVVIETHSELLLLSIQTLVAEQQFGDYTVRLHWLSRDAEGVSRCVSADLDKQGRFGDLPIDLDEVSLQTLERYLNAPSAR